MKCFGILHKHGKGEAGVAKGAWLGDFETVRRSRRKIESDKDKGKGKKQPRARRSNDTSG